MKLRMLLVLALLTGLTHQAKGQSSKLAERMMKEYQEMLDSQFVLLPHRRTFILPVSYNVLPNNNPYKGFIKRQGFEDRGPFVDNLEAEFQISLMVLTNKHLFGTKFNTFLGYTHQAWWQVYNPEWSKPFRETNYMPEIFTRRVLDKPLSLFGLADIMAYDIGYVHQSNGQVQEVSRSWDRIFGRLWVVVDNIFLSFTGWYRLPENRDVDDNPDILRYLGHGNILAMYRHGGHDFSVMLRPGESHFGGEFTYSYPIKLGLRFYTKFTGGYGSSLIDYDRHVERYAFGISLSDPFTRKYEQKQNTALSWR